MRLPWASKTGTQYIFVDIDLKNLIIEYGNERKQIEDIAQIHAVKELVYELTEFNKRFQNGPVQRNTQEKVGRKLNRYKGKEIKGLISENLNKPDPSKALTDIP